ncbi:hypothetical protein ETD86_51435 [Nonomuraea turkmeniaca]|uniref:Core-binding (CB) domain-containing protein n=1 Tax=Nonomuraea turkmeniaca TaxID=103838 RepID=A0A5S4EVP2_9ACTN|nr:hypothetical protein [Nonomuraea turkmeniaca]TMR07591.1 hypothetical protein ETD86_51435 [Nonomuraea turkmeniaca]
MLGLLAAAPRTPLAQHVCARGKQDWALVDGHDIETFLAAQPKNRPRRLQIARQFFRFAKSHKMVLVDPTSKLSAKAPHPGRSAHPLNDLRPPAVHAGTSPSRTRVRNKRTVAQRTADNPVLHSPLHRAANAQDVRARNFRK